MKRKLVTLASGPVSQESSSSFTARRVIICWDSAWIKAAADSRRQGRRFSILNSKM